MVVTDKKGEPVTDLTRGDFVVTDEGAPQKVQTFSHQTNQPPANPPPALPPGTYTNQFVQRGEAAPNAMVVLTDGLNAVTGKVKHYLISTVPRSFLVAARRIARTGKRAKPALTPPNEAECIKRTRQTRLVSVVCFA